jgi:hypothetical protein
MPDDNLMRGRIHSVHITVIKKLPCRLPENTSVLQYNTQQDANH